MKYNFDRIIPRNDTGSVKWELTEELFGERDLLPMWVADMDFQAPQPVIQALRKRAEQGIYGYSACMPSFYDSIIGWYKKRFSIKLERDWIVFCPGIVPAVNMLVQSLALPDDKIILQTPVYYPFFSAVENNMRSILKNPLLLNEGKYSIDFDNLEKQAEDTGASLMILCSPHNPVGRVWTREELTRIGEICFKNNVTVISDEIHSDLILTGFRHRPFLSISGEFLKNSITCNSPSKTFNLAGIQVSYVIIQDPEKRKKFQAVMQRNGLKGPNAFGAAALEASYNHGRDWLGQVMVYIEENLAYLKKFIENRIPMIKVIDPEATYLVWLDFRGLGMDNMRLEKFIRREAGLALDEGHIFGSPEGDGFERINIACPRSILDQALNRLEKAVNKLN